MKVESRTVCLIGTSSVQVGIPGMLLRDLHVRFDIDTGGLAGYSVERHGRLEPGSKNKHNNNSQITTETPTSTSASNLSSVALAI